MKTRKFKEIVENLDLGMGVVHTYCRQVQLKYWKNADTPEEVVEDFDLTDENGEGFLNLLSDFIYCQDDIPLLYLPVESTKGIQVPLDKDQAHVLKRVVEGFVYDHIRRRIEDKKTSKEEYKRMRKEIKEGTYNG